MKRQPMKQQKWDFSGLKALFLSCTLKKSPEISNTEGLAKISRDIFEKNKVKTELIRVVDNDVPVGVYPDMTEHGWKKDETKPACKLL